MATTQDPVGSGRESPRHKHQGTQPTLRGATNLDTPFPIAPDAAPSSVGGYSTWVV